LALPKRNARRRAWRSEAQRAKAAWLAEARARRRRLTLPNGQSAGWSHGYSIRAFAELAGVTVKTLRYYERHGRIANS